MDTRVRIRVGNAAVTLRSLLITAGTVVMLACAPGLARLAAAQPPGPPGAAVRPLQPAAPVEPDTAVAFPGGVVWEATLPGPPAFPPAFDHQRAYALLRNGTLVALSLESGEAAWTWPQAGTVAPVVAGATVVGADDHTLWARDAATGTPRWTHTLESPASAPPAAAGDTVVIVTAAGTLSCHAAGDGAARWRQAIDAQPTAGPVLHGDWVALGFGDGRVSLFSRESGALLWTRSVGGPVLTLTVSDTRVVAGAGDNLVYVLDAKKNGKQRWKWRTGGDPVGDAVFDGKRLYYLSFDNSLRAHNVRNGHLAWTRILQSRPVGSPVVVGDRVVVAGVAPQLRAFKLTDGSPEGVVGVPGRLIQRPQLVAAHGDAPAMLVVVTGSGLVQAIGQTVEPPLVPLERLPGNRLIPETLKR